MHNVKALLLILAAFALAALLTTLSVLIWPQPRPRTAANTLCGLLAVQCARPSTAPNITVVPKNPPVKEFAV